MCRNLLPHELTERVPKDARVCPMEKYDGAHHMLSKNDTSRMLPSRERSCHNAELGSCNAMTFTR